MIDKSRINKKEVIKLIFIAVIIIWTLCFGIDYARARQSKKPLFCLSTTVNKYQDGQTTIYGGLGYKMIKYERASIPVSVQFGPFFIKERTK